MSALLQDLRYAVRILLKSPGFMVVVVATLALGIGVNSAIFTVVNGVLLRPLPYDDPSELVVLWSRTPGLPEDPDSFSRGMYFEIKDRAHVFDQVALLRTHSFTLTGEGSPERIRGARASASCLPMLGARPALGRLFAPGDDEPDRPQTTVLSHALWERRFGADPDVIGRSLRFDEQTYTVIGVLKADFPVRRTYLPMFHDHQARVDYWIPLVFSAEDRHEHSRQNYSILARLEPGVTAANAQAEMDLLAGRMKQELPQYYPPTSGFAVDVLPLFDLVVGDTRRALRLLAGAAGLVLLIACVNVANLLLARASKRRKEIGVRMALGASRPRIVRQLLTESVLLALLGGAVGLLLAWWGTSLLLAVGAKTIPRINEVGVDASVVWFTLGLSLLTGIVFGLVPARGISRVGLERVLREGSRGLIGTGSLWRRRHSLRRFLVVAELSLSMVLLVGAGLLVHSFYRVLSVDPGFSPEHVLSFQLPANPQYADMAAYVEFYEQLGERIAGLPGVESAGGISVLPLAPGESCAPTLVEGRASAGDDAGVLASDRAVLGDYFETMNIPLIAGRYFSEHDTRDSLPVAIVDETFARRCWPNDSPIGKRIKGSGLDLRLPWLTVVGVVGAVRHSDLESDFPMTYYQPYSQWAWQWMYVVVRTSSDPRVLVSALANKVWALDEDRPLLQVATMEQRLSDAFARRRFSLLVLGLFAISALVLAAVGLYGVLGYMVSQSSHEIGLRMALGAQQSDVLRLVLRHGLLLVGIGLAIGLMISLAGARVLSSMLYEVSALDPVTFVGVALLLAAASLLACYIPARRATKVDPLVALRYE